MREHRMRSSIRDLLHARAPAGGHGWNFGATQVTTRISG